MNKEIKKFLEIFKFSAEALHILLRKHKEKSCKDRQEGRGTEKKIKKFSRQGAEAQRKDKRDLTANER